MGGHEPHSAPKPVQMNGVLHHRSFIRTKRTRSPRFETDRLSVGQLALVEAPHKPFHVACEVKNDFWIWGTTVHTPVGRAEISKRQQGSSD